MPHDVVTGLDPGQLEQMAAALEASGQYRVLRRVGAHRSADIPAGTRTRLGILLDLETTGLDATQDEIIEMAMLPFTYGLDGRSTRSEKRSANSGSRPCPFRLPSRN